MSPRTGSTVRSSAFPAVFTSDTAGSVLPQFTPRQVNAA